MTGARRGLGCCPSCHRHHGGCIADVNRQHKGRDKTIESISSEFRDPERVKDQPMKRDSVSKRDRKHGPPIRHVPTTRPVTLIRRCKIGSQVIVKVDGQHMTRHMKDHEIILTRTLVDEQILDDEGRPRQMTHRVWVHETWRVQA